MTLIDDVITADDGALADRELAAEWDELADRTQAGPFCRPGWFEAWWAAFGTGRAHILQERRDGRLVGVFPVAQRAGRVTSLDNWHTFTCGPVAEDAAAATELLSHAMGMARVSAELGHLAADHAAIVAEIAERRRFTTEWTMQQRSPYVPIEGSFEDYMAARSSKFLGRIRQRRRKLETMGELDLVVHDGSQDLDELLAETFRIEGLGWKAESGTAIISQERTRRFYGEVARWAARKGLLNISMLRLSGRVVAAELALVDDQSHYGLKVGYDPEFRTYGPGFILAQDLIERSFRQGLSSFEFMGSVSDEKMRWTDAVREIRQVELFPATVGGYAGRLGKLGVAAGRKAGSISNRIAAHPAVARVRGQATGSDGSTPSGLQ